MEQKTVPTRIEIGWRDTDHRTGNAIPIDSLVPVSTLLRCALVERAIQQLANGRGARHAWATGHALVRTVAKIARYAERDGCRLQLHTNNQATAPELWNKWGQLALEIRAIKGQYIQWDMAIFVSATQPDIEWILIGDSARQQIKRADALVRRVRELTARKAADKQAELEAKTEEYFRTLPPDVQALQRTARATCLVISQDGQTLTEALHDTGGSMTFRQGINDFTMPESLAEMQARHDAVYHLRSEARDLEV